MHTGQVLNTMSLSWDLSNFFPHTLAGVMCFGEEDSLMFILYIGL